MRVFAIWVELPNDVTVQRPHDTDPRHHGRAVMVDNQEHRFDCGLPLAEVLFGLGQLLDIFGGVLKSDELATAGCGIGSWNGRPPMPMQRSLKLRQSDCDAMSMRMCVYTSNRSLR
jgi:hypothetical protein